MPLTEYIDIYFCGNQADFARHINVKPPQITQWINKGFIVVSGVLYSPRRVIPIIH
ncbi:Uncharacterised protein [Yersinia frederiksenii]|nr:Uncharacterised protein [Yersinia frederiksenii]